MLEALQISRKTLQKVRQNLVWAFAYNAVAIPLAAGALLPSTGLALTPSIAGGGCSGLRACWCRRGARLQKVVCSLVIEVRDRAAPDPNCQACRFPLPAGQQAVADSGGQCSHNTC